MPIMAMHDVGPPGRVGALGERRGDPAEEREAAVVVGPVAAVGRAIGVARAVVERRMVDDVGFDSALRQQCPRDAHPLEREGRPQPDRLAQIKCIDKAGKARQDEPRVDPEVYEGRRQGRDDIAKAPGPDPRKELGRDVEDTQRRRLLRAGSDLTRAAMRSNSPRHSRESANPGVQGRNACPGPPACGVPPLPSPHAGEG